MLRMLASLLAIGGVCGLLLVATDGVTAEQIKLNREARARAVMADMLGGPLPADLDVHAPTTGDCAGAIFARVAASGYAGEIDLLALRETPGRFKLRVTRHRETPGIGDFIDHTRDPWITRFDGIDAEAWAAIDNVSGATVTTAAIRRAAGTAAQQVRDHCER